ncbi:fosfomycin resistance protein FosX [Pseudodesulfovibrio nedwellii]|uniref:Fosfomycin resistance protein FosX n=1 Tax=Pseudodesulfovibrio nedwellii TaxID=2973072 RepID=A0ABN6RZJ6_9BACT|nr:MULTISPECIES: FosX/FosE/FosI family fosfomycin resistance hydrolase [Pseudodesulfovibrio]BDQ36417.1 fosfomycin resistance protein FosX [Pseudodesulfovibrio nedwellii]
MIEGLSHITLVVQDLKKTSSIFTKILDAEEVYASGDTQYSLSQEKFFLVGGVWIAIMKGQPLSDKTYNHIAFKIPHNEIDNYAKRIEALNLHVRMDRNRVSGEGCSLYFHDYDNHLFELHTGTLKERLTAYAKDD